MTFWLFGVGALLELLMQPITLLWRARMFLAGVNMVVIGFASLLLLAGWFNLFTVAIALLSGYRIFNQVRIIKQRMHERYLHRSTFRTSLTVIVLQVVLGFAWQAWDSWHTSGTTTWTVIASLQLLGAVALLISTTRRLKRTAWPAPSTVKSLSDSELPTVSVAIPARNESEDLQHCLQSVIASDYPKLEILVLDDCSQTKQTPEIIRSFAHDGVRFVQGEEPRETWLPKTQAYDRLTEEASGEYIIYCGVDVRFEPDSIRQIINTMAAKHKQMMSILPLRAAQSPAFIQAMRYFWELVPPRRLFRRPPILSSCWIISRQALQDAGGFRAVTRAIVPEAHFARQLLKTESYSFMRAGKSPGVTSSKSGDDQRETAIRMRYPQLHRRPENVLITAVLELFFLVLPFLLAVAGFWLPIGWAAQLLAFLAGVILVVTYELMGLSTRVTTWWFGLFALPVVAAYDIVMLHISMWKYEFSTVEWKSRNICIPVMHVIPHLPKID